MPCAIIGVIRTGFCRCSQRCVVVATTPSLLRCRPRPLLRNNLLPVRPRFTELPLPSRVSPILKNASRNSMRTIVIYKHSSPRSNKNASS